MSTGQLSQRVGLVFKGCLQTQQGQVAQTLADHLDAIPCAIDHGGGFTVAGTGACNREPTTVIDCTGDGIEVVRQGLGDLSLLGL